MLATRRYALLRSMVLFFGKTPTNLTVAMIGSSRHLTGDPGSSPAAHIYYTNPAFWAKIAAGVFAPDKERDRGLHSTWYDIYGLWRTAPGAAVTFLAKTFSRPPSHSPLSHPRQDSPEDLEDREKHLLIGSPLFVALA